MLVHFSFCLLFLLHLKQGEFFSPCPFELMAGCTMESFLPLLVLSFTPVLKTSSQKIDTQLELRLSPQGDLAVANHLGI